MNTESKDEYKVNGLIQGLWMNTGFMDEYRVYE